MRPIRVVWILRQRKRLTKSTKRVAVATTVSAAKAAERITVALIIPAAKAAERITVALIIPAAKAAERITVALTAHRGLLELLSVCVAAAHVTAETAPGKPRSKPGYALRLPIIRSERGLACV